MSEVPVRLVVAHAAEARPLVARFGLKADYPAGAFPIYRTREMALVVSGAGKVNAAAASAWLDGVGGQCAHAIWINAGIAGHPCRPRGEVVLARRIDDAATGRGAYPPLVVEAPCAGEWLITVDQPLPGYPEQAAYDMEAAGFHAAASRFTSAELVQVVKVISDNQQHPPRELDRQRVGAWMEAASEVVDSLLERLQPVARGLLIRDGEPPGLAYFLSRFSFSAAQQTRLQRLLQRWAVCYPGRPPEPREWSGSAAKVLTVLERELARAPTPPQP